jgi:hypothetical protein
MNEHSSAGENSPKKKWSVGVLEREERRERERMKERE